MKSEKLELFEQNEFEALEMMEIRGGRTMSVADTQIGTVCGNANCGSQNSCQYSGNCVAGCACKGTLSTI